ncbi:hypothetical protein BCR42DRAFT_103110 [Absidia repens]|uniref:Uncharacterized protein n=1 Tax=Absidia repens TaxID=90262 RepID=A0A1X2I7L0_9FUNG|nr:hypothetical protein BCR42DRAFT_103110 [Absidia repens]
MTSAFNSGIFKTLVEANQRSCDLINSFVGSFDFNRNKSNTLQELKEQTFHTKLYINIQNTLPFIKHNIPKAYCELSYENIVLWIQRALYRINVATFIRFLELDNIYNAGKFSLHHICYEEETRSNDVQAAFVDLRTRLLATLVADEIDTSSNENTSIEMSPLMERTLPLDGSAFGLYPEEDDDFILELLKQRHEMITTLPDSDALDALVTADNLINVWKVAIIASMYRMPALELPPGFPPNQSNDDVYIKQEDVLTDVYSDAQEYQYSQDRHLSQVYQLSQEGESYESNTHGNTPIKQEDDDNYNGIAAQQYGSTTFTTPCDSGDDSDHSYQGVEYLPNPVLATHILPGDDPEFFEGDRYVLASPSLTEHDLPGDDDNDFEGDQYHLARPSFAENGLPDNVEKDDENGQSHLYEPPEDSNYCEDQLGTLDEQNKHPDTNINTDTDTDTDTNINITITINSDSITNSNTNTMNVHSTDKAGDGSEGGGILEENDDDAGNQLEESEADHDHGSVGTHTPIIDWNRHLAPSTAISDPFSDSEIGHDLEDNDDNNEFDLFPAAHEDDYAADVNNMYETTSPWNFDDATEFDINQQYTMVDEIAGDDDIDTPSEMPTKADDTVTIDTHTTAIDNSSSSQAHMDSTSVHGISNQLESSPVDTHLATEAQNDDEGADDLVDEYEDVDNRVEASAEALENDDLTTTSPTLAGAHVAGNDASDSDEDLIDELENDDDDDSEYQLDPDEMDDSSSTNNSYIETTGGEGEGRN